MQRIAIIGGGAAGSAVVGEFLRHSDGGALALTWLVGRSAPGRGVAYATSAEQHLLNVRAANMGLFADDAGALLRFAHERGLAAKASDFLPRALFGDYVETTLARLMSIHAAERTLEVRSSEAVAVRENADGGYVVRTEDGAEIDVDGVIFAVGALPPALPGFVGACAQTSHRYAVDPWKLPRLHHAPQRVVVLGTGLTAVDIILTTAAKWPDAQIVALSRHGCLPGAHHAQPGVPYEHQQELIDAMRAQPEVRHWLHLIRDAIVTDAVDWRSVIDGLRASSVELWRALDETQRGRFLRHLRWLWEASRHRMPPQTAQAIEQLRDEGRLDIVAGRVRSIDGDLPLVLSFVERGASALRSLSADLVIQATGLATQLGDTPHALLRQLIDDGVVGADPLGLGLAADTDGRLFRPDGSVAGGLRALGTLLRGAAWECSGLPEIRTLARTIAKSMPTELRAAHLARAPIAPLWTRSVRHIDMVIHQLGA